MEYTGGNSALLEGCSYCRFRGLSYNRCLRFPQGFCGVRYCCRSSGLTCSGVHVVFVRWVFGGVGCHETSKGAELSCELDYVISFLSWILSCKYPHFMEISIFHGYYPYFVDISVFCGYYPHFV